MVSILNGDKIIVCIFLGRRGGGVTFHREMVEDLRKNGNHVISIMREDAESDCNDANDLTVSVPKNRLLLKLPYLSKKNLLSATNFVNREEKVFVIFTMVHPRNLFLMAYFKKLGIKVGSVIHDAKPHLGERFPTARLINKITLKSDFILCLSEYVKRQLPESQKVFLIDFPRHINISRSLKQSEIDYLLFIGRGKRYKGLALLEKVWPHFEDKTILIIAGKGHNLTNLRKNVIHNSTWLNVEEIHSLIRNAKLVLCPYIEASQSGVVHLSHSLGTPTVVTPIGGLPEQISHNNGVVSGSISAEDFQRAITQALNREWENVYSPRIYGGIEEKLGEILSN
jgi:glycosyltransferase involved in cell wall biosynthesis